MVLKSYPSKVTGLPANPQFKELPCGCRVLSDEVHVVKNEAMNLILLQCKECKTILAMNPIEAAAVQ